jgi:hypothetical protein
VCTTFGDCIEALPPTLTRSISDLRELDAVLSGSISTITDQLNELLRMLEDPTTSPEQRFHHLRRLADEAKDFRLGGEDKIRVATGTCETVRCAPRSTAFTSAHELTLIALVCLLSPYSSSTTRTSSTCSPAYCPRFCQAQWQVPYRLRHGRTAIPSSFQPKHQPQVLHIADLTSCPQISRIAATMLCTTTLQLLAIPSRTAHTQHDKPMYMLMLRIV